MFLFTLILENNISCRTFFRYGPMKCIFDMKFDKNLQIILLDFGFFLRKKLGKIKNFKYFEYYLVIENVFLSYKMY